MSEVALSGDVSMKRAIFRYPVEFKTLPEYTAHANQVVEVLYRLKPPDVDADETLEPMFKILASDGWQGDAFESELLEVTDQS